MTSFFLFFAYCGMKSVSYALPTTVFKVFPVPCLVWNDKCFLYFAYWGMTIFLCFLPNTE